jgi:hypothetical protein
MLVLVMKWWAFALASNGVATMTIAAKGDEAINKIYIRTSALFSGLGGLGLTYVNLEFANKMNAGADGADPAPTDMGPIYFNVGLQVFGLVLGLAATAGSKGHGHSHGHAHADKKEEEHHGHGHDEDGNCMDHGHGTSLPRRSRPRPPPSLKPVLGTMKAHSPCVCRV